MPRTFELVAGHPALDLVNTLDWRFGTREPEELLANYRELLALTVQSGVLTPKQAARLKNAPGQPVIERCVELREALAVVIYAWIDHHTPPPASIRTLERIFQSARERQELQWKEGRLEWIWPENDAELPLLALAGSASDLMLSNDAQRVRACGNPECRWLFLDTSKNHTRRWCDMKLCGNRMKARRFKAQRKSSPLQRLSDS